MKCDQIGCDALPFFMFCTLLLRRNERLPERNHCFSERFHRAVRGDADRGERPPQTQTPPAPQKSILGGYGGIPALGVVVHRDQHHPLPRSETALKNSDSALGNAHSAGAVR